MSSLWLSAIIPAYNEAERIHSTLDRLLSYLRSRGRPFEVLVVDDGSADRTEQELGRRIEPEVRVIRLPANRGKGAAVRQGVQESRGELVLMTDADLSAPIEEMARLEARLQDGFSLACGSRALPGSETLARQPLYRETMGKIFNWIVRALRLSRFRDTQCGFKLFRGEAAREIFSRCRVDGFAFDVESLYVARQLGYSVAEVPIRWRHIPESRVHPFKDSAQMLFDLIRICLGAWRGSYSPRR